MLKLKIETGFKSQGEFYNYAKKNLKALIRGYLPCSKDRLKSTSRENEFKRKRNYDCLLNYRYAAMSGRIKKVPFFAYWLSQKSSDRFLDTIAQLSIDQGINPGIRERLDKTLNSLYDSKLIESTRIIKRYSSRNIGDEIIKNTLKGFKCLPFDELQAFMEKRGVTDLRDIRNCRTIFREMRPEILGWMLEILEEEGRIEIKETSARTYFQSV
jgi:hypothetical protein